jgi:FecR protein
MPRHTMRHAFMRKPMLFLSMLFTLIFSLAPLSRAQDLDDEDGHDSHARIVRISYIEGEVRLDNGNGYENATMNVPVTEHNWLQTRSDGWVEVQLEDGSLVRLAPDTVIAFTELSRLSSGGTLTTIDLDQGEAAFKIAKHDGSDFQVTVKNKTIALTRTGSFRVTNTNANPMEIVVWSGEVSVRDPESGGEVTVGKNETFVLDPTDVGRYALDKGAETDGLDQWSKQRDDYLSTYASSGQNYSQSPYQYGVSDLNQYGTYFDAPGYGDVWQPNGVGLGWDPFSNGYWSYTPGFGYTWISSYPWGWMPYRYGRWVFIRSHGWCWAPGGWNRWWSRPRWANAPPGFRPPIPPKTAPAPHPVAGGSGGNLDRSGNRHDNGRPGARSSGPGGSGFGNRDGDGDNRALGNRGGDHQDGNRGNRRVLTNDDVQGRVPRADVPAQNQPPAAVDADRKPGREPRIVTPEPAGGAGEDRRHETGGRFGGDRVPRAPANQANETPSQPIRQPAPPQSYSPPNRQVETPAVPPVRQSPPPQSYSPPNRQPEYTPPPAQVRQPAPAPPPPPAVHQAPPPAAAPAPRQSSPPPESRAVRSDDSSRGRPK